MRSIVLLSVCALFMSSAVSCTRHQTTIASPDDDPKDQWSRGVWLYSGNCANCHGENGEGNEDAPAIAGKGALPHLPADDEADRKVAIDTAADLFGYVKESMPPLDVGCLTDDQLYAVMNYVLKQADISFSEDITRKNAGNIKLR
jgi:cytochrome c